MWIRSLPALTSHHVVGHLTSIVYPCFLPLGRSHCPLGHVLSSGDGSAQIHIFHFYYSMDPRPLVFSSGYLHWGRGVLQLLSHHLCLEDPTGQRKRGCNDLCPWRHLRPADVVFGQGFSDQQGPRNGSPPSPFFLALPCCSHRLPQPFST